MATVLKKEKLHSPTNGTMYIGGGWSPWYPKPNNKHRAYDMTALPGYNVYSSLAGKIVKTTSIPFYAKSPWLDDYGFSVKSDAGEWLHYNHCRLDSDLKYGSRVKKGMLIGIMDTIQRQKELRIKWLQPDKYTGDERKKRWAMVNAFTGRHIHFELITGKGVKTTDLVNPLDFMDRKFKLGGQYQNKQYSKNKNLYIVTKKEVTMNWKKKYQEEHAKRIKCAEKSELRKKQRDEARKELASLRKKHEALKKKSNTLTNRVKELEDTLERQIQLMEKKNEKIENQKTTIANLEKQNKILSDTVKELDEDLKKCKEGKPSNLVDKLLELIGWKK